MRITQSSIMRNYMKGLNRAYGNMSSTLDKLTTGRRFSKAWEDVGSAARALNIREELATTQQRLDSIDVPKSRMDSAYSNLMSVKGILDTASERVEKGVSENNKEDHAVFAQELESFRDQVLQFMNAEYSDRFLFGNSNNASAPFTVDTDGSLLFNGAKVDDIQKDADGSLYTLDPNDPTGATKIMVAHNDDTYIDLGLGMAVSGGKEDSRTAFKTSFSGIEMLGFGTDADGMSNNVFNLLNDLAKAFKEPDDTYNNEYTKELWGKLQDQTDNMMLGVTELSSRANFLEKTQTRLTEDVDNLKTLQDKIEMCDEKEQTANLKQFQADWQATLQYGSYAIPQSIFDFMR